jgi:radical SAM protein with 4Fe4S-binding SPASM domain
MTSLLGQKIDLLRGLLAGDFAYAGPINADIFVSSRCNLHCLGCRYHGPGLAPSAVSKRLNHDISFDIFEKLLAELKVMGTHSIIFTGDGEPLCHPRLPDMVALAKELGFHVTLITNGTLLDDLTIQALIESHLDILHVSLWASSAEEYQRQYPGADPDSFRKVTEAMMKVVRHRKTQNTLHPLLKLHHPINRHNCENINRIADLGLSIGCDLLVLAPLLTFGGLVSEHALSSEQERTFYGLLSQLRTKLRHTPVKHTIDHTILRYRLGEAVWKQVRCYAGWFYTQIGTDGRVFPCSRSIRPMGDLHKDTFRDIWNGPAYRAFRMQAMTLQGLAALQKDCNCEYCFQIHTNLVVHRIYRRLAPFRRHGNDTTAHTY